MAIVKAIVSSKLFFGAVIGFVFACAVLVGPMVYEHRGDHAALHQLVQYVNAQIAAQQRQQEAAKQRQQAAQQAAPAVTAPAK